LQSRDEKAQVTQIRIWWPTNASIPILVSLRVF